MFDMEVPAINRILAGTPTLVAKLISHTPGAILAGGAVRDILLGSKPSDFDLFVKSADRAEALMARAVTWGGDGGWKTTSDRSMTAWVGDLTIQACHGWAYDTPVDLLKGFDFTVCQAAIWDWDTPLDEPLHPKVGAWAGMVGEHFDLDCFDHRLRLVGGIERTTMERVIRLYSKGFIPDQARSLSGCEGGGYIHQAMEKLREELAIEQGRTGRALDEVERVQEVLKGEELFIQRVKAKTQRRAAEENW